MHDHNINNINKDGQPQIVGNLCSHLFLKLQPAGIDLNGTGKFAQTGHLAVGNVGDAGAVSFRPSRSGFSPMPSESIRTAVSTLL